MSELTKELFDPFVKQPFQLALENGETVVLDLIEVTFIKTEAIRPPSWGEGSDIKRDRKPFSVVFRGPLDIYLPQQIYSLYNEQFGKLEAIFLVPVSQDKNGLYYEAVFN